MINTDDKNLGGGSHLSVMLNSRQFHFSLNKLSKKTKVVSGLVFTVILSNGGRGLSNTLQKLSQKCYVCYIMIHIIPNFDHMRS